VKFKIGDRVRIVRPDSPNRVNGKEGTVWKKAKVFDHIVASQNGRVNAEVTGGPLAARPVD